MASPRRAGAAAGAGRSIEGTDLSTKRMAVPVPCGGRSRGPVKVGYGPSDGQWDGLYQTRAGACGAGSVTVVIVWHAEPTKSGW